ncbi:MAG: glycosyltransferase family 39 protein, partial [Bryobacteraceae bacterium]|nr:glycosyltransferase family 39 protein [Bryobacteraceae bacterium]
MVLALAVWSAATTAWVAQQGWTAWYGDAEAHLNIARRIVDSRTPGYEQIGTVWLPLPHLLMAPLAARDDLWRNGLAGAIPPSLAFVGAGCFFYAALLRALASRAAALSGLALLATNPNLLYLKSTPMTEAIWLATLAALLYFTVRYRSHPSLANACLAGLASLAGTLTRYEGWFLIPFVALYLLAAGDRRRWAAASLYCALAAAGPIYWLIHNWWLHGDALEFYRGPYSARAIYQRSLDQGMARYPGDHDWEQAWVQLREAARLCAGWPLGVLGLAGALWAVLRRRLWLVALTALPVLFYWLSLYGGGTPIFVPHLWPHSYYNTRYGLAALPLLAAGAAAGIAAVPRRARPLAAAVVVLAAAGWWLARPSPEAWICWKESQVNSEARRAWTEQAALRLVQQRRPGEGVVACFGDLAGVFRKAGIPLRHMLHEGNGPAWLGAMARPDLFLREPWAVVTTGDAVATALLRLGPRGPRYDLEHTIIVKGGPV